MSLKVMYNTEHNALETATTTMNRPNDLRDTFK